tara:strand:+ start:2146 stop:2898 length:753 start_codon:yes stop_codon:yes gene_type:complete
MTRVFGLLFEDERDGILAIKPSKPFFGCQGDEQHIDVINGTIDCDLLPTPNGITYLVGFKGVGDTRRTSFTLRWRIPNQTEIDITPAKSSSSEAAKASSGQSVYERVQLKRIAGELNESLEDKEEITSQLEAAEARVKQLEEELQSFRRSTDIALRGRDATIAQLNEQNTPEIKTVYLEKPVPPKALHDRIKRLEQENQRLIELNAEYYKSVVDLHQLKLNRAQSLPSPGPIITPEDTPRQRLINKLIDR